MTTPRSSLVGSHVAVAGGLVKTGLAEAREIGAEVIQVFAGNPRGWRPSPIDPAGDAAFRRACEELGLPVFVHAPYLINFGSPTPETVARSADALAHILRRAASIGAEAVVVHAGSSITPAFRDAALGQLRGAISPALDAAPAGVRLLIEPTAGGGAALASTLESTAEYLNALDDERVGLCLDTCHLHAAGEDLGDPAAFAASLKRLAAEVGDRVGLLHVNDSRDPMGSKRDRHESLGLGEVGGEALASLFAVPALRGIPLVIETPTHARDVALLKEFRAEAGCTP